MARRALVLALVAALLGSIVGVVGTVAGPVTPAGADAVTERPLYGRNEAVVVAAAQITFERACPTGGIPDWVYPVADIYVVKGVGSPAGAIADASGTPNTVFGFTGGGVFDEVVGYTAPRGSLGPGTYSLVIDECQDGKLGAEDTFVPNAFTVLSRVVGPQLTNISGLKAKAQIQADRYNRSVIAFKALLMLSNKGPGSAGKGYGLFKKSLFLVGVPNPGAIATAMLGSKGKHYAGIAADPPDPAFAQATALAPTAVPPVLDPTDPFDVMSADAIGALATSAALTESLLHSMERYQGAWSVRDGEWQLAHARAIQDDAALLADQVALDAPALDELADAVAAQPFDYDADAQALLVEIDDFLANGPTAAERADLANEGLTQAQFAAILSEVRAQIVGLDTDDLITDLRAIADEAPAEAAVLDTLAADTQSMITALEADPFVEGTVPDVDAGGPYTGAVGAPIALDASGTAGPAPLTYTWDLDGDGQFDDATGATTSFTPTATFTGLAGVKVASGGETSIGYAHLDISGGPAGPFISNALPAQRLDLVVPVGTTQAFTLTPGGSTPTTTWYVDSVQVGTGPSFSYSPVLADAGQHLVEAIVTDTSGQNRKVDWYIIATAADVDGDGYWAHVDCNDSVATTYPGAPELLDSVDNDCDPTSPDGGVAPVVNAGAALAGGEGTTINLTATFTHPSGTYTATVDWGNGVVGPGVLTGKTVKASYVYPDNGVYSVNVCVKAASGKTGCKTTTATISNASAGPKFSTLHDWTEQEVSPGNGVWTVAPDGLSVFQSINGDPTFFMADSAIPAGVEAGVTLEVETTGDDDLVGFALGLQPGFITNANSEYLLLDWKQGTQAYTGCGNDSTAEEGLAVSRVTGVSSPAELWAHIDCPAWQGGVIELARGTNLGTTGWTDNTPYNFRIRYTSTHLQIWVNEVLEFDLTGTFPLGRLGFYNYSQSDVRYSGYQLVPGDVIEGTERQYDVSYDDPGTADTHTGRITWGDGTPDDALDITEVDGEGTGSKAHQFLDDGAYDGEVCITDDDLATACQQFPIAVANAAPVVLAGRDRVAGPALVLDDSSFSDPGVLDTHTATVDWGDGSATTTGTVSELMGEGSVSGSHIYTTAGTYDVEVCVTDDDAAETCDTFSTEVRVGNVAPEAMTDDDVAIVEGDSVGRAVGFTDTNPQDTHTATIDWGDGSPDTTVTMQANGSIGSGGTTHTYPQDGEYTVTAEVCDNSDACDTDTSKVTVANAPPVVTASGTIDPAPSSLAVDVAGAFTDVGVDDSHTATIDWDDGSALQTVTVTQATNVVNETHHVYAAPDTYDIEVCVTDSEEGTGCDEITLNPAGQVPSAPLDVSAVGGNANARVRWDAPVSDGGSPLIDYEVETTPGATTATLPATGRQTTVAGLINDADYTFRVRASNTFGWGPWSEPSNVARPRAGCPGAPFNDVGPEHPFCPEIKWMGDNGVSTGYADNTYRPSSTITRQAMAAFSYRLLNPGAAPLPACTAKPFNDVEKTNTFCREITWMKSSGIASGYPDGGFHPNAPVARQAMAAFLYRLDGSPLGADPACTAAEFTDVAPSHAFCGEIRWLVGTGVAEGYADGSYGATAPVARQAMAAFIFRYNIYANLIE